MHRLILGLLWTVCSCSSIETGPASPPIETGASVPVSASSSTVPLAEDAVSDALARWDRSIEAGHKKAQSQPTDWSGLASVTTGHMQRARLTGDYADYAAAEKALAEAFVRAGEGNGPFVLRASLNATLHRLGEVERDLDHVADWPAAGLHKPSKVLVQRAAFDFHQGRIDEAKKGFNRALQMQARPLAPLAGLALVHRRTGDLQSAEGLYEDILGLLESEVGEPVAWTHLQLGLLDLDRGRYAEAEDHYSAADRALPGYWLVHEHIAEIQLLSGRRAEAIALYERVIADTDGSPEFLDALAEIRREDGDDSAAAALAARALAAYEARLAQFPEATYGHALDHFLAFGPPDRALAMAEKNHSLRPNGPAKVGLMEALVGADKATAAASLADEWLASQWRSAEGHAAAAEAFAAVGRTEDAELQRAAARAMNPRVFD